MKRSPSPDATPRRNFLRSSVGLLALGTAAAPGSAPIPAPRAAAADVAALEPPNDRIRKAREAALAVLKPSAKDLEHGLRLHAESLVFESYGFAPRCAIDGAAFQSAAEAGASDAELVDLREEMTMTRCATDAAERREFLDAFRAAGVTCIFQNAGEEGNDPLLLVKRLARYTFVTDLMRDDLFKAARPDDIVLAKQQGRRCLCFTANGVPLAGLHNLVRDELAYVRIFHQLGIRMMHVTYNRRNPLGDGCGEPSDGGLSDFGRAAIAEMNRVGVIVDVAHSGWRTSLEAAKASKRPMVASHTTAAGLFSHFRGKPDEVLRAICDTGGLAGVCCIPRFLGGTGDVGVFLDHLAYIVRKFGADHAAIGMDVGYTSPNDDAERRKVAKRADGRSPLSAQGPRWEHLWPAETAKPAPHAEATLAWTNWPLFTVGMVQRGFKDDDIRKILGENMLRVARANFDG